MYSIIAVALCKIHNKEEYNNNWLCKKVPPTTIVSALCILLHTIDIRTVFLTAIPTKFVGLCRPSRTQCCRKPRTTVSAGPWICRACVDDVPVRYTRVVGVCRRSTNANLQRCLKAPTRCTHQTTQVGSGAEAV